MEELDIYIYTTNISHNIITRQSTNCFRSGEFALTTGIRTISDYVREQKAGTNIVKCYRP